MRCKSRIATFGSRLFMCIIITCLMHLLSLVGFYRYLFDGEGSVMGYLQNATEIGPFRLLALAAPSLTSILLFPDSLLPCNKEHDEERGGAKKRQILSRLVSVYAAGNVCAVFGYMLFALLLRSYVPFVWEEMRGDPSVFSGNITFFVQIEDYWQHTFLIACLHGCFGGFTSVLALAISSISESKHIVMASTLASLQFIAMSTEAFRLPASLRPILVSIGHFIISDAPWLNYLWAFILFSVLAIPFSLTYYLRISRLQNV